MYGMVNKSVQDFIATNFGADKWDAIRKKAGVVEEAFIGFESYPDAMTYQLVGAASELLGIGADALLFDLGEFWVLYTARTGYGDLLSSAGRSLPEFLEYLPMLHTRVALTFPNLKPPRFEYSDRHADRITMHYFSHRPGLSVYVQGLLSGIAKLYDTPAQITQTHFKDNGADHDEYLVCWGDTVPQQ